jgi:hypothetical protein
MMKMSQRSQEFPLLGTFLAVWSRQVVRLVDSSCFGSSETPDSFRVGQHLS